MNNPGFQKFMQEKHILKIRQSRQKLIELEWDFSGLISNNLSRKHLFLCLSFEPQYIQYFKNLSEASFAQFKCGDLYSVRFIDSTKHIWAEKMKMGKINYTHKKERYEVKKDIAIYWSKFLERNLQSIEDERMPTSVCLLADEKISQESIAQHISRFRILTRARTFFFVLHTKNTQPRINFSDGISWSNIWNINKKEINDQYFKIVQSQACRFVELSITCSDYDICGDNSIWKQVNFDSIQRKLYYPLNLAYLDILEITIIGGFPKQSRNSEKHIAQYLEQMEQQISELEKAGCQKFTVAVKYELLDGSSFYSEQEIQLALSDHQKFHSFNGRKKIHHKNHYTLPWGLSITNNPFDSNQIIGLSLEKSTFI